MRIDRAIGSLKTAQRRMKDAHFEACQALAEFDAIDADQSYPVETRIAARSLKQETLAYCERMRRAMESVPTAALPTIGKKVELPCIKTAAWMLKNRQAATGPLAASVNYGKPICA